MIDINQLHVEESEFCPIISELKWCQKQIPKKPLMKQIILWLPTFFPHIVLIFGPQPSIKFGSKGSSKVKTVTNKVFGPEVSLWDLNAP